MTALYNKTQWNHLWRY